MKNQLDTFSPGHSGKLLNFSISALLLIVAIVLYLHYPSGYNQGLYHYQGLVLKNGGLPYDGFVEKKGLLALLTYSLASLFFGEASWAYRLFDILILSGIGITLFKIIRERYSQWQAVLALGIWGSHLLIEGPSNTGDVTNLITLFTVILARHLINDKKSVNYLWAGILMALSCWVKPTAFLIYLPLVFLFLQKSQNSRFQFSIAAFTKVIVGLLIPTVVLTAFLLVTGTIRGFWESLVLEPYLHYAQDKFRLSIWAVKRTAYHFIQDPLLRIAGISCLFLIRGGEAFRVFRLLTLGIFVMIILEGRLFPYHFSILWPFLTIGFIHGLHYLSGFLKAKSFLLVVIPLMFLLHTPLIKIGERFKKARFLTSQFDPGKIFILKESERMFRLRQPVVDYLKPKLSDDHEIFVFGHDPNIYLELGKITTCRFAREAILFTETESENTPQLIIDWKTEYLNYLESGKADWLIVLKEVTRQVIPKYQAKVHSIFTSKYEPVKETEGHIIYRKK